MNLNIWYFLFFIDLITHCLLCNRHHHLVFPTEIEWLDYSRLSLSVSREYQSVPERLFFPVMKASVTLVWKHALRTDCKHKFPSRSYILLVYLAYQWLFSYHQRTNCGGASKIDNYTHLIEGFLYLADYTKAICVTMKAG